MRGTSDAMTQLGEAAAAGTEALEKMAEWQEYKARAQGRSGRRAQARAVARTERKRAQAAVHGRAVPGLMPDARSWNAFHQALSANATKGEAAA